MRNSSLTTSLLGLAICCAIHAQSLPPLTIVADLTDAPRKILHAHLSFSVEPGPLTLLFPEWIPGEHSPSGPIDNLAGLVFTANGRTIPWHRDDVKMFAIHVTVPAGVSKLEARLDFLATAPASGFSAGASTNANLALLSWNELLLYPAGKTPDQIPVSASIKIPEDWKFGTALVPEQIEGPVTSFRAVPITKLIDSPVLAGKYFKEIPLAPEVMPKHFLDLAADGPEDLTITDDQVSAFSNLVREAGTLYASHHYASYHFLLTLSDDVAHFGLEHHESSDDRVEARTLIDDDLKLLEGSLLPHEFTHSWNGKYRRPAGLATGDYDRAMKGELLWVYEGMTQYWGDVLATRSGIWTPDQFKAYLAASAADLDHRPGRTWRSLQDTATAAQILYSSNHGWDNWRRNVDYYGEGELIWLEADTLIRKLSAGKKSLNDFCAKFFAAGGSGEPAVLPYTFEDLVRTMNEVQPYGWSAFFHERLESTSPHAPLSGISNGGYKLEYTSEANDFLHAAENKEHGVNAWYSLGFSTGADNQITDVLVGSPADKVGFGPDMKVVAINGRKATDEILHGAIRDSKTRTEPIEFILDNNGYFKVVKIDYHGGELFPHLIRNSEGHSLLDDILAPMTQHKPVKVSQEASSSSAAISSSADKSSV